MGKSQRSLKEIAIIIGMIAIASLIVLKIDTLISLFFLGINVSTPFIIGGAIAFIVNIPMYFFEEALFTKPKSKLYKWKRPISMFLSIFLIGLIIYIVVLTVVPQLFKTLQQLGMQIPIFINEVYTYIESISKGYPEVYDYMQTLEIPQINWNDVIRTVTNFLKTGIGSVVTQTVNIASGLMGGIVSGLVAVIFAIYILTQKEILKRQTKRVLTAYCKQTIYEKIVHVLTILYKNLTNFITGQCIEAVIIGVMFVIAMTLFNMPYAVLIGVLIAFMALIPVVGAFIGCGVGAFLILVDNPVKALWFIVLFLILQQIEGNLIYPKVVGDSIGLPAIWVLVAVSLGASLFGVIGILTFIPLFATAYTLLKEDVAKRNG
ncbi:MAG: AI-2E family transporter [Lachnospiraceae bacterium]